MKAAVALAALAPVGSALGPLHARAARKGDCPEGGCPLALEDAVALMHMQSDVVRSMAAEWTPCTEGGSRLFCQGTTTPSDCNESPFDGWEPDGHCVCGHLSSDWVLKSSCTTNFSEIVPTPAGQRIPCTSTNTSHPSVPEGSELYCPSTTTPEICNESPFDDDPRCVCGPESSDWVLKTWCEPSPVNGPFVDQTQCTTGTFKFDAATYSEFCPADNVSFSGGYCAFVTGAEPVSCNAFCFANGQRTCVAGANSKGGCEWKAEDEGAGTAAFCDKVISANVCACSNDHTASAPEESECAQTFNGTVGFKGICEQSVMTFAGGNCPVLVQTSAVPGATCDAYCQQKGLTCLAAAESKQRCSGWKGGGDAASCSDNATNRQICVCDQGLTAPPSPAPVGEWCEKLWKSRDFSKCDYWGDPHFKKTFAGKQVDIMGLGAFLAAGTKTDYFEVQNFQCPWGNKVTNTQSIGIAVRFGSDVVVIGHDAGGAKNKVWINGVNRSLDYVTAITDLGLSVSGDIADTRKVKEGGGLKIMGSDCKHRWLGFKRLGHVYPFYSYGSMIRVPEDDQLDAGMCSGCEYQQHLGKDDLLFSAEQIASFCGSCIDPKPDLCTTPVPVNATPVPVDDRCVDPPPPCEDPLNSPGCGRPAAEIACAKLENTTCFEGCVFDYCAGDCQETGEEDVCEEDPPDPPVEPDETTAPPPDTTYEAPTSLAPTPTPTTAPTPAPTLGRAYTTLAPTPAPTPPPTPTPTPAPTPTPTTLTPTPAPTLPPTPTPTPGPTPAPTPGLTPAPTTAPTLAPTPAPTPEPTKPPSTPEPTEPPTPGTTAKPPTTKPTPAPTAKPPVTVTGDPHVTNVQGQRFNLQRVGVHELLRLPRGPASRPGRGAGGGDALLRVLGTVESEKACAEPFVRRLDVTGLWLRKTGPLVLRASGEKMDGADAAVMEVNGSRVGVDGLARDERLHGLLQVSEPKVDSHAHPGKIRRDRFLTATLSLPGATLKVDWIHREVPGLTLNHLDLHVADLPKLSEGMDVGGILGRDDHTLAASRTPGCAPTSSLISYGTGSVEAASSQLGASYKYW